MKSKEIRKLEPRAIWDKFADLNAVPRPSKKEERVIDFMLNFGRSLGLETFKDKVGNVVIRKPGTAGFENRKTVTLQSHLDMVHQKNAERDFDFDKQGIEMYVEDGWVKARGTTLGADNGIGVAAIMALLQSSDLDHPPLEALFTIDEETGMTGAKGLEPGVLQGDILLNLDTEDDDEIDIGCAGGIDITASRTYKEIDTDGGSMAFELAVKGLRGGHSGMDIHLGLGNANKLMNRILYHCGMEDLCRISSIDGGGLRNAIPRESFATVVVRAEDEERFSSAFEELSAILKTELGQTERDLQILLEKADLPDKVMAAEDQQALVNSIYAAHNGVYAMSRAIPDLVETSNNIARVKVEEGRIQVSCLTRSSVESAKLDLAYSLRATFELGGFQVEFSGDYPGWNPNPDSRIVRVLIAQYKAMFEEEPRVVACHAGLECGILGQHYPELDMVSFGPTIKGAHSPDERVKIESVRKFWNFLKEILRHTPVAG